MLDQPRVQGVSGFLKNSDVAEDVKTKAGTLLDVMVQSAADKRLVAVTAAPEAVAAATLKDDAATDLGGSPHGDGRQAGRHPAVSMSPFAVQLPHVGICCDGISKSRLWSCPMLCRSESQDRTLSSTAPAPAGNLLPGTLVNARVKAVLSDGLQMFFLTYFVGTVDHFHLGQVCGV